MRKGRAEKCSIELDHLPVARRVEAVACVHLLALRAEGDERFAPAGDLDDNGARVECAFKGDGGKDRMGIGWRATERARKMVRDGVSE